MSYGWQDPESKVFSSRDKAKFKRSINALDKVFISKESQQTEKEDTGCVPKGKKFGVSADQGKSAENQGGIEKLTIWTRKMFVERCATSKRSYRLT